LREENQLMWRMRVVHATGYAYKSPVTASYNEARLTPRSDSRQNVILNRVETIPATRNYRYVDYWGTAVTAFDLHAPHTELEVTASSVVETDKPEAPAEGISWEVLESDAVRDRFDEVLESTHYTPVSRRLERVGKRIAAGRDPRQAVIAAAQWAHSELSYVPGTTGVHSSGLDALREGKGVCQDYAHLALILLRGMGIPARYVSGYLHPNRDAVIGETIDGQSHAWIQAWTGAWVNYDPTNDSQINEQYISVGVGRDYADVTPLKGIYSGEGSTDLDVVVEITRLA
jgi:transglutaminase-like putative cysteine protease